MTPMLPRTAGPGVTLTITPQERVEDQVNGVMSGDLTWDVTVLESAVPACQTREKAIVKNHSYATGPQLSGAAGG